MVKIIGIFLLLGLVTLTAAAQKGSTAILNLGGEWVIQKPKVQKVDGVNKRTILKLIIEDGEPEIKITEYRTVETLDAKGDPSEKKDSEPVVKIYYTDYRGETNSYEDGIKYKSQTTRPKNSLFIRRYDQEKNQTTLITFYVSEDRRKLTISSKTIAKIDRIDMEPGQILPFKTTEGPKEVFTRVTK